jgi:hypothetical protein
MSTAEQTTPVETHEEAKTRLAALKEQLSKARKESTQAKRAVTVFEKAVRKASDEDRPAAEAKVTELTETRDAAIAEAERLESEHAQAKLDVAAAKEREAAAKAEERANKPKKAPLTLSQRRALLKLGDGPQTPSTGFNALPYEHLVNVGLATVETVPVEIPKTRKVEQEEEIPESERKENGPTTRKIKVDEEYTETIERKQFTLNELGTERVTEINPKWKTWRAPSQASADATPADGTTSSDDGASA